MSRIAVGVVGACTVGTLASVVVHEVVGHGALGALFGNQFNGLIFDLNRGAGTYFGAHPVAWRAAVGSAGGILVGCATALGARAAAPRCRGYAGVLLGWYALSALVLTSLSIAVPDRDGDHVLTRLGLAAIAPGVRWTLGGAVLALAVTMLHRLVWSLPGVRESPAPVGRVARTSGLFLLAHVLLVLFSAVIPSRATAASPLTFHVRLWLWLAFGVAAVAAITLSLTRRPARPLWGDAPWSWPAVAAAAGAGLAACLACHLWLCLGVRWDR